MNTHIIILLNCRMNTNNVLTKLWEHNTLVEKKLFATGYHVC